MRHEVLTENHFFDFVIVSSAKIEDEETFPAMSF